jgi:hypothetical protein
MIRFGSPTALLVLFVFGVALSTPAPGSTAVLYNDGASTIVDTAVTQGEIVRVRDFGCLGIASCAYAIDPALPTSLRFTGLAVSSAVEVYDTSDFVIDAGEIDFGLTARDIAFASVTGGTVGFLRCTEEADCEVMGGDVEGAVSSQDDSTLVWAGGTLGGGLEAFNASTLRVIGSAFVVDDGGDRIDHPFGEVDQSSGRLEGILEDGSVFDVAFQRTGTARILLIPDALQASASIENGCDPSAPSNLLDADVFVAVDLWVADYDGSSPTACPDPETRTRIEVATGATTAAITVSGSSEVRVRGGEVLGELAAFDTALIDFEGGDVDSVSVAGGAQLEQIGGATAGGIVAVQSAFVRVQAGSVAGEIRARDAARVEIGGGSITASMVAESTGTISLEGSCFELDGQPLVYGTHEGLNGQLIGEFSSDDVVGIPDPATGFVDPPGAGVAFDGSSGFLDLRPDPLALNALLNNGELGDQPTNVVSTDRYGAAGVFVRNADCGVAEIYVADDGSVGQGPTITSNCLDPTTPVVTASCSTPGDPTVVEITSGGRIQTLLVLDTSEAWIRGGVAESALVAGTGRVSLTSGRIGQFLSVFGDSLGTVDGGSVGCESDPDSSRTCFEVTVTDPTASEIDECEAQRGCQIEETPDGAAGTTTTFVYRGEALACGAATLEMTGGAIDAVASCTDDCGSSTCEPTLRLHGSTIATNFVAGGGAVAEILDGSVLGKVESRDSAIIVIEGGSFGTRLEARGASSSIVVLASSAEIDGVPVSPSGPDWIDPRTGDVTSFAYVDVSGQSGNLVATFANGAGIDLPFAQGGLPADPGEPSPAEDFLGTLRLVFVPEPAFASAVWIAVAAIATAQGARFRSSRSSFGWIRRRRRG